MQNRSILSAVLDAMSQPAWRAAAAAVTVVLLGLLIGAACRLRFAQPYSRPPPWSLDTTRLPARVDENRPPRGQVRSKLQYIDFHEALGLLHMTLQSISARVAILDRYGNLIEANDLWQTFGKDVSKVAGEAELTAEKLQLPQQQPEMEIMLAATAAVVDGDREHYKATYSFYEGVVERTFEFTAVRIDTQAIVHILVSHNDITSLRETADAVRELSKQASEIEEDERQRIAGELHDVTGQHLIAISLNLMNLRRQMAVPPKVERLIEDIEHSAEEAQREIRLLSYLLYPPQLEDGGAKATIEQYASGFARRAGLQLKQGISDEIDALPIELQRSVLRIIQEALANVHRHARARSVALKVAVDFDALSVEVKDDGRGFREAGHGAAGHDTTPGVGIPGMKARLRAFNGNLQIESSRKGTVLTATIPIADTWLASRLPGTTDRVLH